MTKSVLTYELWEPLNGVTTASVDVNAGDGNLTIDRLAIGEPALASGALQYIENQDLPIRTLVLKGGQATLTLKGGRAERPRFRLPWAACNGATEWQIHLNPTVLSDITAHSNGGNVRLNLVGMTVTRLAADTGGGNMDVVLPDNAADLSVTASAGAGDVTIEISSGITGSSIINANSGAGNVVVCLPSGVAARIHATTGLGKVTVSPLYSRIDNNTYQSTDFGCAVHKVVITIKSGAGNVSVKTM